MKLHTQYAAHPGIVRYAFAKMRRSLLVCTLALGVTFGMAAAEVTTDQTDYAPGTTALISGSGFSAGESVVLQVLHSDGTPGDGEDHEPWSVQADAAGAFVTSWHVCEDDCVDSTLLLVAVGESSGLQAQATFADAPFFGVRLTSVLGLAGACTRTVPTATNLQVFVQPGQAYRFNFSLSTNGSLPACYTTSNNLGPLTILMSLGPNFGNATFVARRLGANLLHEHLRRSCECLHRYTDHIYMRQRLVSAGTRQQSPARPARPIACLAQLLECALLRFFLQCATHHRLRDEYREYCYWGLLRSRELRSAGRNRNAHTDGRLHSLTWQHLSQRPDGNQLHCIKQRWHSQLFLARL